jgi:hypothetical protein
MCVRFSFQGPRHPVVPAALGSRILLATPVSSTSFFSTFALFVRPVGVTFRLLGGAPRPDRRSEPTESSMWRASTTLAAGTLTPSATDRQPVVSELRTLRSQLPACQAGFSLSSSARCVSVPAALQTGDATRWNVSWPAGSFSSSALRDFFSRSFAPVRTRSMVLERLAEAATHGLSPHVKEQAAMTSTQQGSRWLNHRRPRQRLGVSTAYPQRYCAQRLRPDVVGLAAPCSPAGGRRNIVRATR